MCKMAVSYCHWVTTEYLRLINLKGTFSVLAGSCWRTKNRLHFLWGPFLIQPIILFLSCSLSCCWNGFGWKTLWGKFGLVSYCQKLPKTLVGCTFMRHNSRLCASQLPVVCAWVGKKSIVIMRQSMVITRQGNYMPDKNATSISGNGNGGERQLLVMLSPWWGVLCVSAVERNWNRVYSKRLFSAIRSVRLDFLLLPKHIMVPFRFISLILWSVCGEG